MTLVDKELRIRPNSYEFVDRIDKSVPRITVWHHYAQLIEA